MPQPDRPTNPSDQLPARSSGSTSGTTSASPAGMPWKPSFPSLLVRASGIEAQGRFAQTQARFLSPDPQAVASLRSLLQRTDAGIVAHFYMDPELQGVLSAVGSPRIHISDSLVMADRAVAMAEQGAKAIAVLGVDFMSESVRAMLDHAGFDDVPVYRLDANPIGCSLAEAADTSSYLRYLQHASEAPCPLHVVYINTSLPLKARAHRLLPTITCTSSNVMQTLLQVAAQVPEASIWFGPDTYMGDNLAHMLEGYALLTEDAIRLLHPAHTQASLRRLRAQFHFFQEGTCIVHHLFGSDIVRRVRSTCGDAYLTAHLEVPGEMFALAAEAARTGRGVVGSTSQILHFITDKVREHVATERENADAVQPPIRFVLGTEAGMVTSIVRSVQAELAACHAENPAHAQPVVEIIFPTADEAVTDARDGGGVEEVRPYAAASTATTALPGIVGVPGTMGVPGIMGGAGSAGLPLIPGASGEGCSTSGGCATCPFMKQNTLTALMDVLRLHDEGQHEALRAMQAHRPADREHTGAKHPDAHLETTDKGSAATGSAATGNASAGSDITKDGGAPILAMRVLQKTGSLPEELTRRMRSHAASHR